MGTKTDLLDPIAVFSVKLQPTCIVGTKTQCGRYTPCMRSGLQPTCIVGTKTEYLQTRYRFHLNYSPRILRGLKRFFESSVYFDFHTTWRLKTKNVEMGKIVF